MNDFAVSEQLECEMSNSKKSDDPKDLDNCSEREQRLQHKLEAVRDRLKIWEQRLKEYVCAFVSVCIICVDNAKVLHGCVFVSQGRGMLPP